MKIREKKITDMKDKTSKPCVTYIILLLLQIFNVFKPTKLIITTCISIYHNF